MPNEGYPLAWSMDDGVQTETRVSKTKYSYQAFAARKLGRRQVLGKSETYKYEISTLNILDFV